MGHGFPWTLLRLQGHKFPEKRQIIACHAPRLKDANPLHNRVVDITILNSMCGRGHGNGHAYDPCRGHGQGHRQGVKDMDSLRMRKGFACHAHLRVPASSKRANHVDNQTNVVLGK